jgi:hypothetical protein
MISDGEAGLLVDFFDHSALAVDQALDDMDQRAAIAWAARQVVVDRYDQRKICLPVQIDLLSTCGGDDRERSVCTTSVEPRTGVCK